MKMKKKRCIVSYTMLVSSCFPSIGTSTAFSFSTTSTTTSRKRTFLKDEKLSHIVRPHCSSLVFTNPLFFGSCIDAKSSKLLHFSSSSSTQQKEEEKKEGAIEIESELPASSSPIISTEDMKNLISASQSTIQIIRDILGYPKYEVSLTFVDDDEMTKLNLEYLEKNKSTDILSFPFDDELVIEPGKLDKPMFDIPDLYHLGDMVISVPYVLKQIENDLTLEDYSGFGDDIDERGIAYLLPKLPKLEDRVCALLVHGMLHLVGYDHIIDEDYELMVVREEEVWKELKVRLKEEYGKEVTEKSD